jgi:hypothetical protein
VPRHASTPMWRVNIPARGQVELWPDASHAINGEYPAEIAETAAAFWDGAGGT